MAATATDATLSTLHPNLIVAVRAEAARSADRVGEFLRGVADRGVEIPPLARDTLLELAAALTLAAWEGGGLELHREAGLPPARVAVRYALATVLPTVHALDPGLIVLVVGLFADRMAWHAREDLAADVTLDAPDEDALIEHLARFLWDRRHTHQTDHSGISTRLRARRSGPASSTTGTARGRPTAPPPSMSPGPAAARPNWG